MKRQLKISSMIIAICAMLSIPASMKAQDYMFSDNIMMISQVESQWHKINLYSAGVYGDRMTIRNYFVGFQQAFPVPIAQYIVDHMLGFKTDGVLGNVIIDENKGYISAELLTELTQRMQMCYWKCNDGGVLIAVAFVGDEYKEEHNCENEDEEITRSITDMTFYRIFNDEMLWHPVPPSQLLGQEIDFNSLSDIQLPRQGKDIMLISDNPKNNLVLKWNGNGFKVVK